LFVSLASLEFTNVGGYPATPLDVLSISDSQEVPYAAGLGVNAANTRKLMAGFGKQSIASEVPGAFNASAFNQQLLNGYYRSDGRERYAAFRFQSVPNWDGEQSHDPVPDGWTVSDYRIPGEVKPNSLGPTQLWPDGFTVPIGTLWEEKDAPLLLGNISVPMSAINNRLQVDLFWNSSARDAVPMYYHALHNQVLQTTLGNEKLKDSSVKIFNQPFPLTVAQKDLTDTQTSLFLALGFAFIPASYGAFVVMERETNSKHIQVICGVNFVSYWFATWLWDMLNYLVPATLSILMIACFGVESLVGGENLFWTILCVLMYGVSCTSFTYMLTFLFKSATSAQNMLLVMYLFTGGILEIVAIVLGVLPDTQDLMNNVLIYLFRLLPNFCLADALTNLIARKNPVITFKLGCPLSGCDPYDMKIIGWDLLYME
jgi:hypothetical protein